MNHFNSRLFAALSSAILVAISTGSYADKAADELVAVTTQDTEGLTQKDMDLNFLKVMEAYMVQLTKTKVKEALASKGYTGVKVNVYSKAVYIELGQKKLAVIRINGDTRVNEVVIFGIVGNAAKRVSCINKSGVVSISYGACADKIQEVFGTKIGF